MLGVDGGWNAGLSWVIWILVILAVMGLVVWTTGGRSRRS